MKIFISWSGTSSRLVAEALSDWLERVIQAAKPFNSFDIDKGAKWSNKIDDALEGTRFGIICLTPDNLESSWIHYEAGALSKAKGASIWTFLLELKPSDVKQPLGKFQHTLAEKADVLKMLKSINAKLNEIGGESLKEKLLEEIFEESWAKLEARLNEAKKSIETRTNDEIDKPIENVRNTNDKLDEILESLRSQQRKNNAVSKETYSYVSFELPINKLDAEMEIKIIKGFIFKTLGESDISVAMSKKGYKFEVKLLNPATREKIFEELIFVAGSLGYDPPYFSSTPNSVL
jgi:hypothetical protein